MRNVSRDILEPLGRLLDTNWRGTADATAPYRVTQSEKFLLEPLQVAADALALALRRTTTAGRAVRRRAPRCLTLRQLGAAVSASEFLTHPPESSTARVKMLGGVG